MTLDFIAEIESQFMPWLLNAMEQRLTRDELARQLLDGMFCNVKRCAGSPVMLIRSLSG
jgi:hypothetical protein